VPGEAEPNLIATQTGGSDDALIAAAVIALAVVLGTVGVVFYRKKAANAEK
jgi:LPXTG-motif cell wall-anchored protein